MARFIKIKLYDTSVDSGTTTAATADKLTQSGQNFLTTVKSGDYVIANGIVYTVTAVDSNTVLSVTGGGVPDATAFVIYSGSIVTERLFSAENIVTTTRVSENSSTIEYNHAQSGFDSLRIAHTSDASTTKVMDSINELVSEIFSGKRAGAVVSDLNTDVVLITGVFA
jgi:hypothetical protein